MNDWITILSDKIKIPANIIVVDEEDRSRKIKLDAMEQIPIEEEYDQDEPTSNSYFVNKCPVQVRYHF